MRRWLDVLGPVARYRGYFWKYRRRYVVGVSALILTNGLQLALPQLVRGIVDRLQAGAACGSLVAAVVVTGVLLFGVRIVSRLFILDTSRHLEFDLLDVVYAKLQRLPLSFYLQRHTGDLMSRASNDVRLIRSLSGFGVLSLANLAFFLALALLFMLSIDPLLTATALTPFAVLLLVVRTLSGRLRSATLRTQEALARLSSQIQETLAGITVVQAYGMERVSLERFERENDAYRVVAMEQTRARSLMMPFMSFASGVAILLVVALGGRRVVSGAMSFGEFVAFHAYMGMLVSPTVMLGWTLSLFQRGLAAFERLSELLDSPETLSDPPPEVLRRHAGFEPTGAVRAAALAFRYPAAPGKQRRPALYGVSFRLDPGEMLGVVGPVGSGKTTLLRLVARHLEAEPGCLLFDEVSATELPLRAVRRWIGFVPQEDFLFSASIAENIAFGRPDATAPEIERAARLAHVHDDIERFPDRYGTLVGERGLTLSGGQRQRIALARALLIRPRILILDDALSKVDADTASAILAGLREAGRGLSVLVASHRVAAVQQASEILVLDQGEVRERGSHSELLERSGYYRDMARRQRLESEVEALQ
jgi:ATP-binding cassette subfamily B protein